MGTNLPHIVLQPLEGNVQYATDDITNVNFFNYTPDGIVVRNESPFKTYQDFVAAAKKDPGKLNLAGSGTNSANHAAHERLNSMAGIRITHVPYKGTQLSMPDLMSGQIGILFDSVLTAKPHIDAKRVVALTVSSKERSNLVPDMPTMAESGLPGFDSWTWFGLFAPAGTPQPVADRVNAEVNRIVADPAVRERFAQLGFETTGGTPSQFAALVDSETVKWSKVIRDANVKPE